MNRIVIFSGTTEGRMLAQTLSENGIQCIVSVATEYGESVMPEMEGVTVHKGRMDWRKCRSSSHRARWQRWWTQRIRLQRQFRKTSGKA